MYMPRLFLTAFALGVRRTFVYELLDEKPDPGLTDPQQHFGLLRYDLSPKPAFTALKTLLRAVRASPGAAGAETLPWSVQGAPPDAVRRVTLVRRDGSRLLAVWRPVSVWDQNARRPTPPEPLPVTVDLGRTAGGVTVWRPSVAPEPVARPGRVRRLPLALEGDVVLVSLR